jgi:hypothetical protein
MGTWPLPAGDLNASVELSSYHHHMHMVRLAPQCPLTVARQSADEAASKAQMDGDYDTIS